MTQARIDLQTQLEQNTSSINDLPKIPLLKDSSVIFLEPKDSTNTSSEQQPNTNKLN